LKKEKSQTGGKHLQIEYLKKNLFPGHIKNYRRSVLSKQITHFFKWAKDLNSLAKKVSRVRTWTMAEYY
jgi:hypothetical protein